MGTAERRSEIMKKLIRRRHETISNLAFELGVSDRTVRRDIEALSLTEPIYTQTGRYGGGVYIVSGYHTNTIYMSEKELGVLHKICEVAKKRDKCDLCSDEIEILMRMVKDYEKPKILIRKEKNYEQKRKTTI